MTDTSLRSDGLAAYVAVTAAYWAFMLTDGALRMLVLLHFQYHQHRLLHHHPQLFLEMNYQLHHLYLERDLC